MDTTLELIVLPVTDVDRAKTFYGRLGFDELVDNQPNESFRIVQMTPPQSGVSIAFGVGLEPPSEPVQGLHLVVADVAAALADLRSRGIEVDGPFHFGAQGQTAGLHPERADYGTYGSFRDPDGNGWLLQEVSGREGMKLEIVVVPTADVERSKRFYERQLGFTTSTDFQPNDAFRVVQLDPPGSPCSITIGTGIGQMAPGSLRGLHLVVADLARAHKELVARGLDIGEPFHFGPQGRVEGLDPNRADYASFATFDDPDGNTWLVQDVPSRA